MDNAVKSTMRHIGGDTFEITDENGRCYGIRVSAQDKADRLLELANGVTPLYIVLTPDNDLIFSKAPCDELTKEKKNG